MKTFFRRMAAVMAGVAVLGLALDEVGTNQRLGAAAAGLAQKITRGYGI